MRKVVETNIDISKRLKEIGSKVTQLRQAVEPNYKKFSEINNLNNMTLWRIQNGEDYRMSSFLSVLQSIGISPEDFFKGIK